MEYNIGNDFLPNTEDYVLCEYVKTDRTSLFFVVQMKLEWNESLGNDLSIQMGVT